MFTRRHFLEAAAAGAAASLLRVSSPPETGPVTLRPEPTYLEALTGKVAKQSGESLSVDASSRWDGVMVSASDRPAEKVKADLAELFHYGWSEDREKPLLGGGARLRNLEQSLRGKLYGDSADRMAEYCALLDQPPEAIERARQQRQFGHTNLDAFKTRAYRLAIGLWATLTREQAASIFAASSHRVYVPWREMAEEQRRLALALAQELENPSLGPQYPKVTPTPHAVELMQQFGVVLLGWTWDFGRSSNVKYVEVHCTKPPIELAYDLDFRPAAPVGKANRGSPYELSARDPNGERGYADLERMPFPAKGFRQTFPMTWEETFHQLAEQLHFALYSDYFTGKSVGVDNSAHPREVSGNPDVLPLEKMRVAEVLDALCSWLGQVWWRKGDAIFFRSRSWFVDRLFQAPRDVLAICRQQLTDRGRLDRDAVDRLARLSWQDMTGLNNLANEESTKAWFAAYFGFHHGLHRLLQVYATLKPEERDLALGDGLPAVRLGLSQRRAYGEALFIHDAPYEMLADLPPLRFEQRIVKGIAKKRPNLCQLLYAPKPGSPDYQQDVIACLYLPFPVKEPEAML